MCVHEDRKSRETILLKWVGVGWGFKVSMLATLCLLLSHIIAHVYFAFTPLLCKRIGSCPPPKKGPRLSPPLLVSLLQLQTGKGAKVKRCSQQAQGCGGGSRKLPMLFFRNPFLISGGGGEHGREGTCRRLGKKSMLKSASSS